VVLIDDSSSLLVVCIHLAMTAWSIPAPAQLSANTASTRPGTGCERATPSRAQRWDYSTMRGCGDIIMVSL